MIRIIYFLFILWLINGSSKSAHFDCHKQQHNYLSNHVLSLIEQYFMEIERRSITKNNECSDSNSLLSAFKPGMEFSPSTPN